MLVGRPTERASFRGDPGAKFLWGKEFVHCVKTMAVQNWLDEYPHSRQVKSHIRRYMHILFNAAIRWEMLERNPIDLVRQPSKRLKAPSALTPDNLGRF